MPKRDPIRVFIKDDTRTGEDYRNENIRGFHAVNAVFDQCDFTGARMESAYFGAGQAVSLYRGCIFDKTRMRVGPTGAARFENCSFRDVVIKDLMGFAAEFVKCTFTGRLEHGFLNGRPQPDNYAWLTRASNEIRDNDFSEAELVDFDFRTGVDLTQQVLPTGQPYLYLPDAAKQVAAVRRDVITWDDLDVRRQAPVVLNGLEEDALNGQRQLLLREDTYPRSLAQGTKATFEALRRASASV